MSELKRKEEDLLSPTCIKQVKMCSIKRIKTFKEYWLIVTLLSVKKGELYLKLIELYLVGTTREVQDPKLILNYMLMTREQFEEHLEILKIVSVEKFNSLNKYTEQEVESWLVNYVNKNEDIEDTLHQLSIDFRDLESTLFNINVRQEIIIVSMRDYIENWLKKSLIKITEEDQAKVVGTSHVIATKENTKGTSPNK
jgi:hypothetical protein